MGFGDGVSALLETYSKCLDLLNVFKSSKTGDSRRTRDELDQQALLRRSLRSDRAQIQRAYSSRLSESGSRFEKGDTQSDSALQRVLRKLSRAIAGILGLASSSHQPVLDYESLMSLSNASRIDAIRAIDQLSHRLASPSRSSVASSVSAKRRSTASSSKHKRHRSSGSTTSTASSVRSSGSKRDHLTKTRPEAKAKQEVHKPELNHDSSPRRSSSGPSKQQSHSRTANGSSKTVVRNRLSMASASTDSTKLGEIPERKWRSRYTTTTTSDSSLEDYNVSPTYPLQPFTAEAKERRFWGLFRRKPEAR